MKTTRPPNEILVYQCDELDGEPIYAIARNVEEIPEDMDDQKVAVYVMNKQYTFKIRRELK